MCWGRSRSGHRPIFETLVSGSRIGGDRNGSGASDRGDRAWGHPVGHLPDDGTPRAIRAGKALVVDRLQAVQMIRDQPKERRRLGAPGFVDAARGRRRVCHWRSVSVERRAYARSPRRPPPSDCARGSSNARYECAGLSAHALHAVLSRADRPVHSVGVSGRGHTRPRADHSRAPFASIGMRKRPPSRACRTCSRRNARPRCRSDANS